VPHGYCTGCEARVTVRDGECLLGHSVDPATIAHSRGHRIAGGGSTGPVGLLERTVEKVEKTVERPAEPGRRRGRSRRTFTTSPAPARPAPAEPPGQPPRPARGPTVDRGGWEGLIEVNPTTETILDMWDSGETTPLDSWEIGEVLDAPPHRHLARWVAGILVATAVTALWLSISALTARSDARRLDLHQSTVELADLIGSLSVDNAAELVDDIDSAGRRLFSDADELPLGDPDRALAIDAAGQALGSLGDVSDALAYRSAVDAVVGRPPLPGGGDPAQLPAATELLTGWRVALEAVLAEVPATTAFETHRATVDAYLSTIDDTQATYLDAVRVSDPTVATSALVDLDQAVRGMIESLPNAAAGAVSALAVTGDVVTGIAQRMSVATSDR